MKILSIVFLTSFLVACGVEDRPFNFADEQILAFHQAYNVEDLDAILDGASDKAKKDGELRMLGPELHNLRFNVGKFIEGEVVLSKELKLPLNTEVLVAMDSRFRHGAAIENFYFVLEGGEYKLSGYSSSIVEDMPDHYESTKPVR